MPDAVPRTSLRQRPPSSLSADEDRTVNHYASTLEVAPVRAQDVPRRHDRNEIRQDGRQLHDTAHHAFICKRIVQHACKSLSPWPIIGRVTPSRRGGHDNREQHTRTHPASTTILALASTSTSGTWRPGLLSLLACRPLYEHHGATQYSASSTPLRDVRPPAGTRINPVSLVASTRPSRGRSQRSLLVSVGTTFRTDSWRVG
jgi:hypothetical protein